MDDLDREIEEAQRDARRRVWRERFATIASTATFLVVGAVGTIVMYQLFPDAGERELDARLAQQKRDHVEPDAGLIAQNFAASLGDRGHTRLTVAPAFALAFASAYFVSKKLKPRAS